MDTTCSTDPTEFFAPNTNCERCIFLYTGERCNKPLSFEIFVIYNVVRSFEVIANFFLMLIIIQRCYTFWKASPRWFPFNAQRRVYAIAFAFTVLVWPHIIDGKNYDLLLPIWLVAFSHGSATGCLMLLGIEITFSLIVCSFPLSRQKMPNISKFYSVAGIILVILYVVLSILQYYFKFWLFRGTLLLFDISMLYFLAFPLNIFTFRLYWSIVKGEVEFNRTSIAAQRLRTLLRFVLAGNAFILTVSLLQLYTAVILFRQKYSIHEPNAKLPPNPTTGLYVVRAFYDLFTWLLVYASVFVYRHVSQKELRVSIDYMIQDNLKKELSYSEESTKDDCELDNIIPDSADA